MKPPRRTRPSTRAVPALLSVLILLVVSIGCTGYAAGAEPMPPALDNRAPQGPPPTHEVRIPKLSTALDQLLIDHEAGASIAEQRAQERGLDVENDQVNVMLIMENVAAADAAIVAIPKLGGEVTARYDTWIDARVPVVVLAKLAKLPGVSQVREPIPVGPADAEVSTPTLKKLNASMPLLETSSPRVDPAAGSSLTQGVVASGADAWHAAGWNGAGLKIGIIDEFGGYQIAQQRGDLPANIQFYNQLSLQGPHGTACAEIIHDMAPGAQLTFASVNTPTELASAIVGLAQTGHKIISISLGYVAVGPGDGSGVMNNAIRAAYLQYGALTVVAAGNHAEFHYDAPFTDQDANSWHEFAPGQIINALNWDETAQQLKPLKLGQELYITLRWDDWTAGNQNYDLYLMQYTAAGWTFVQNAWSVIEQNGGVAPVENISYRVPVQNTYYGIAIYKKSASGTQSLDLGGSRLPAFYYQERYRSITEPGDSPYAFTVAAVDTATSAMERYSSWGPARGAGGTRDVGVAKPNISGFANVDTTSYGARVFNGTSAATPHVAGAAALVWQAYPGSHAGHIWDHFQYYAIDRGTAGHDYGFGAGVLRMMAPPAGSQTYTPPNGGQSQAPPVSTQTKVLVPMATR